MNRATSDINGTASETLPGDELPLREVLSEVYHDTNNALSVISGNVQLLEEIIRAEQGSALLTEPLEDIQAARAEISEALARLDRARKVVDPSPGSGAE